MTRETLYADGACVGNPGPGGYCAIRVSTGEVAAKGGEPETTNNRMELVAAIEGLRSLEPCEVVVVSDSRYLVDGATKWVADWVKRGWRTKGKSPVLNRDLWEALLAEQDRHDGVFFRWVRGHAGDVLNERANDVAEAEALALVEPCWSSSLR